MISGVIQWMNRSIEALRPVDFENHSNVYVVPLFKER